MSRRLLISVLFAAGLTLAVASPAAARVPLQSLLPIHVLGSQVGEPIVREPEIHTGFHLDPPGPYVVNVLTRGEAVAVAVGRGNGRRRFAATEYLARGVATPERLQATFGNLGKISMRFRESRHRPWFGKKRRCRGDGRFVVRRGVFVGNFSFRGEDDYLRIRTHRAKGSISTVAPKCRHDRRRRERSSSPFEESFSGLIASDRNGVNSSVFGAVSFRNRLIYVTQREESRGKLAVLQTALVFTHGRLPLNEAVTAGKFSPGPPFHGTGRYQAAPDGSTSWSGNLSVNFPGSPRVPLTGPTYETFLEAGF